jgi:tetratricopeptide (TPR) repeat protein
VLLTVTVAETQSEAQVVAPQDEWRKPTALNGSASNAIRPVPIRHQQIIGRYQQALQISRELKNRAGEGTVLSRLGLTHLSMGQYPAAVEYFKQALAIQRELEQRREEGNVLNNLGNAYFYLKQYETAISFYEQALAIRRTVGDRAGEGITLGNLARTSQALGRREAANALAQQSLEIAREVRSRESEGNALNEAGFILLSQRCYPEAIQQLEQALVILREVGARAQEADALHNLMLAWKGQGKPNLAIFYGKQAVNLAQEIKADNPVLHKDIQSGLLTAKQDSYRELADLLIEQDRLTEAQQVLNMLKEEEYLQFARSDN